MMILGIDPGLSGGLSLVDFGADRPIIQDALSMPTIWVTKGKKRRRTINLPAVAQFVDTNSSAIKFTIIEEVSAMPKQGVTSMFNFGRSFGVVEGIVAASFIPLRYVRPRKWKLAMGLNADKGASVKMATEFFPQNASEFERSHGDGVAEAALLAVYAHRQEGWQPL